MPGPVSSTIQEVREELVTIDLSPAVNVINSLRMLMYPDTFSGMGEWIYDTYLHLSEEKRLDNCVAVDGLYYGIRPERTFSSFPAYLRFLEQLEPLEIRRRLFDGYTNLPCCLINEDQQDVVPDFDKIAASFENYLAFLKDRFSLDHINEESERRSYELLADPPVMKKFLIAHFRFMWDTILAQEWQRNLPLMEETRLALLQKDFSGMSKMDVVKWLFGGDYEKLQDWEPLLDSVDQIIITPSLHRGPYKHKYIAGRKLWIVVGSELPDDLKISTAELSRSEILVRSSALSDDTRLKILKLLSASGELSSSEIMERLDLSQSAASRHLKLLSTSAYLNERRLHGAKYYSLNSGKIKTTLDAISAFLLSE